MEGSKVSNILCNIVFHLRTIRVLGTYGRDQAHFPLLLLSHLLVADRVKILYRLRYCLRYLCKHNTVFCQSVLLHAHSTRMELGDSWPLHQSRNPPILLRCPEFGNGHLYSCSTDPLPMGIEYETGP